MYAFRLSAGYAALAALAAATLSGCSQTSELSPSLGEGVTAPEGAGDVVSSFVDVCSAILLSGEQPGSVLAENGWELPDGNQAMALGGIAAEKSDFGMSVQVIPFDYPHLEGMGCSVNVFDGSSAERIDTAELEGIPGFLGGHQTVSNGDGQQVAIGRWSGVSADGSVVTINAMKYSDGQFVSLSMNKSKPVKPA